MIRTRKLQHKFTKSSNLTRPRYGAMYIGILLSAILYGVCILQVFQYFLSEFPCPAAKKRTIMNSRVSKRPVVFEDDRKFSNRKRAEPK